ncbi:hypothetical protein HYW20_04975 [Candidatus Woesearchaeota archaeon]|nr:hypothetical protein [Candidatus Woesearchaeota archaeon]
MQDLLNFLPEHKRKIFLQYPFIRRFLESGINPQTFLEDLRAFKFDLIKKGITEADIMSLEDKLKPKSRIKFVPGAVVKTGPNRNDSVEAWRNYWKNNDHVIRVQGADGNYHPAYEWINGREIRVFRMPDVNERVAQYVIQGVNDIVNEVGLNLQIKYFGAHPTSIEQVKQATQPDGRLSGDTLSKILVVEYWRNPAQGGSPHADIVIVNQYIVLGNENWGQSEFNKGYSILAVPNRRQQSLDFIRNVAKHETGHLLGFQEHHDMSKVNEYKEPRDCNMLWRSSTLYTCEKCLDALKYFWKGIEERTGKRFFKK